MLYGHHYAGIKEFVNRQKLDFIATVCPDRTPKGTTIARDDGQLVFADIHFPVTVNNLLINPAIEINVVDIFIRKGYPLKGVAKVMSGGLIFDEVISFFIAAGSKHIMKNTEE